MLDLKQVRKKSDVKLGSAEDDGFDSRDCVRGVCSQLLGGIQKIRGQKRDEGVS